MSHDRIVVIGASSGGVRALQMLVSQLAPGFPAPIVVVQHIGSFQSILPSLLMRNGPLPSSHVQDHEQVKAGHIHVAPPDHHVVIEDSVLRLSRGAKEHHARPAIDPLFRSAAVSWGPAAVGVLLTGMLDDGTAGLQAIKRCGGVAVVQDPGDAESPSMPLSALRYVEVDHCVALASMGRLLRSLLDNPAKPAGGAPPAAYVHENEITMARGDYMEHMTAIGTPSTFTCPECDGTMWYLKDTQPPRYRCHTGHAYSLRSLQHAQAQDADGALWNALRALHEKEMILRSLAHAHRASQDASEASQLEQQAREVASHAEVLRTLIEAIPSPPE